MTIWTNLAYALSSFIEISNPDASKELIKAEMGVGILADWAIEEESKKRRIIKFVVGAKKIDSHMGNLGPKREKVKQG